MSKPNGRLSVAPSDEGAGAVQTASGGELFLFSPSVICFANATSLIRGRRTMVPHKKQNRWFPSGFFLSFYWPMSSSAAFAAACSASFLLWPVPSASTLLLMSTSMTKRLSWSGPDSLLRR